MRELMAELRALLPEAIFCLDAEGGRVDRLRPSSDRPRRRRTSRTGRQPWIAAGRLLGRMPRSARWVSIWISHPSSISTTASRQRSRPAAASGPPRESRPRAGAFLDGLHDAGVGGCLKHFPGLGRAAGHDTICPGRSDPGGVSELERDLAPFVRLLPRAESLMVGHAIYPGWDPGACRRLLPDDRRRSFCGGGLRPGRLLSDDLEMGALGRFGDLARARAEALAAGCDGLLFCRRLDDAPRVAASVRRRPCARAGRGGSAA